MASPREYVNGPSFTPLPHGLLSALASEIRTPDSQHWTAGVTYETLCGGGESTYDECFAVTGTSRGTTVTAPEPPSKSETAEIVNRGATSFTVYAEVDCSAPGFWDHAEEYAARALADSEQYQVERSIWTGYTSGAQTVFPHLAANVDIYDDHGYVLQTASDILVSGIAVDVVEALGRLEGALADCYDGVGIIHVPRDLAAAFHNAQLLIPDGTRYRTANGNIVVFGSGYTGSAPTGTVHADHMWIYATSMLFIYRGPVHVMRAPESINRATNTVYALAERTYVVGWECCHIGVSVSLGGMVAGAPNSADATVVISAAAPEEEDD